MRQEMKEKNPMPDTYLPGDTRQRIQDLIKNRKIPQAELADGYYIMESSQIKKNLQLDYKT